MGCAGSKLEDLQAVAHCRNRTQLLESAIRHRYSLAQAHLSYLHSLKSLASSLYQFFHLDNTLTKSDPVPRPDPIINFNPSDLDSHLHFQSDNSDSDPDPDPDSSPLHQTLLPITPPHYSTNARSSGPAAASVEFAGSSYPYSAYADPYSNYGGKSGFFGSPPPAIAPAVASSSSQPPPPQPPPPPSPPRASNWDFLNPFESSLQYYAAYTPGRDSKAVLEEEGIPDLEDEEFGREVVKEVRGEQRFVAVEGGRGDEEDRGIGGEENMGVEYEVHMVDKKAVPSAEKQGNVGSSKAGRSRGISEVVSEIKAQFDRASDSGSEVSKILEAGKVPYHGKNAVFKG